MPNLFPWKEGGKEGQSSAAALSPPSPGKPPPLQASCSTPAKSQHSEVLSLTHKGCSYDAQTFISQQRGKILAVWKPMAIFSETGGKQKRASAFSPSSCVQAGADWEQTLAPLSRSAFPIKIGVSNRTSYP